MGKLHSQLALFGSIDDEVVRRNDPRTTAIVESFLPGTTGYGQRGWFGQLREFIDDLSPTGAVSFPSRDEALLDLTTPGALRRPTVRPDDLRGDLVVTVDEPGEDHDPHSGTQNLFTFSPPEFEELHSAGMARETDPPPTDALTVSTLARSIYAGAVIARLEQPRDVEPPSCRTVKLAWPGRDFVTIHGPGDPVSSDPLSRLLDLATPRYLGIDVMPTRGPRLRTRISRSRELDRGLAGWKPFMRKMDFFDVSPQVATYPPPCVGRVRDIGGQPCAVVTTEIFEDCVDLEDVEAIVDPQNWHQDLPSFFCAMEPRRDSGGWSQILECVSTECAEYRLKTALKYWNAERGDYGIYINYDLADDRRGDSGLVEVDSGYIWITKVHPRGVRIRTSKALRICGLSPTAVAALACFSGWAQVGIDMLVNAALNPHQGAVDFDPSILPDAPGAIAQSTSPTAAPPDSVLTEERLPDLPPGFRQDLIEDTAEQLNRYIDATSRLSKNFLRRWQNGLTRTDLQRLGDELGDEITSLAVGSFDSVMNNFRPKSTQRRAPSRATAGVDAEPARRDFVDRATEAARRVVDRTTSATAAAADKIDGGSYTASDMADTATRLAGIAVQGWLELTGITPQAHPDEGALARVTAQPNRNPGPSAESLRFTGPGLGAAIQSVSELANRAFHTNLDVLKQVVDERVPGVASVVVDHMTNVARRMADQAKTVADDAATTLETQGYGVDDWVMTMMKLGDVALVNGIDLAGTALIGPGRYETRPIVSDYFLVPNADAGRRHVLSLVSPLVLAGTTDETVSEDRVGFDPADRVLPAGTAIFRIRVRSSGLRSGIYVGAAWAVPLDAAGSPVTDEPVKEQIVPLIIGL